MTPAPPEGARPVPDRITITQVRLCEQDRNRLIRLKAKTGIKHWNVLCRWAFCVSLAEPTRPTLQVPTDTALEIGWETFGGPYQEVYLALLKARCHRDGAELDAATLAAHLRAHLHRGIGYLFGNRAITDIRKFVGKALGPSAVVS